MLFLDSCAGFESLDPEIKKSLYNLLNKLERLIAKRMSNPFLYIDWIWHLTSNYTETKKSSDAVRGLLKTVIKHRK